MRGFFVGFIWGVIIVGAGLVGLSLYVPLPASDETIQTAADNSISQAKEPTDDQTSIDVLISEGPQKSVLPLEVMEKEDETISTTPEQQSSQPTAQVQSAQNSNVNQQEAENPETLFSVEESIPTDVSLDIQDASQEPQAASENPPAIDIADIVEETDANDTDANDNVGSDEIIENTQNEDNAPYQEPGTGVALVDNAKEIDLSTETRPYLSVILTHRDDSNIDQAILENLPFHAAVVVDPEHENVTEIAQTYHELGFEIMMSADAFTSYSDPTDLAVAFEAARSMVPNAVAMFSSTSSNARAFQSVIAEMALSGHGYVKIPAGLNSDLNQANDNNVPALPVYRVLDAQDEAASVIIRYLSRAAFEALEDGYVIVAGQMHTETLSALIEWHDTDRAQTVASVPISAVLQEHGLQ